MPLQPPFDELVFVVVVIGLWCGISIYIFKITLEILVQISQKLILLSLKVNVKLRNFKKMYL